MHNPLSSKAKKIDGKTYVELPAQVADKLNIKEGDPVEFGLSKHEEIWKSQQVIMPEEVVTLVRAALNLKITFLGGLIHRRK